MPDLISSMTVSVDRLTHSTMIANSGSHTDGSVFLHSHDAGSYSSIQFGGTPAELERFAAAIAAGAAEIRQVLRRNILRDWAEAHPEEATPLDHGGRCERCQGDALSLFAVHSSPLGERERFEVCAQCACVLPIEAETLAAAVRLTEDETPEDVRGELHDDGIDDELVTS